jgi:TraM recognition site of TraD and TraG
VSDIFLGYDAKTGAEFCIPKEAFQTHFHLIGGTGKGKTTAIHTLLHPLLLDHRDPAAFFIIDRMGNLSFELLLWITSKYCTDSVRRRVLYIEPSREDVVIGFNPLLHETPQHGFYKVQRATDIILRAWESVDIEKMPRLARWTFNAFWAAAQLGLTIADCGHFLMPGSPYHARLLECLPPLLKAEWEEIVQARGNEASRILESSRNRLKPYFEAPILRRMFGATESRLDVLRFMREGRIVLVNLAPQNRLSPQLGDAIGALIINEVLSNARSLPLGVRYPSYLLLDEFQNFVGPDLESAIPEVRQLGIRLILSHQSFAQLQRGDYDLTTMIWQAQSRIAFGVQGEDADILGHELASLTYNPKRVKDELFSTRQRIAGHEKVMLSSWGKSGSEAESWDRKYGKNWARSTNTVKKEGSYRDVHGEGDSRAETEQEGKGGSRTSGWSENQQEHLLPVHEEVRELASRTFYTGDEWDRLWAKRVRTLPTGTALVRLVNDPTLSKVKVERSAVGYLGWDASLLQRKLPQVIERLHAFLEANFRSEFFQPPHAIEAETEARLQRVLRAAATVHAGTRQPEPDGPGVSTDLQAAGDDARAERRVDVEAPAARKNPFVG